MFISVKDYEAAEEWLDKNLDKWKMPVGEATIKLLVPPEQVPPYVITFIRFQKANDEEFEKLEKVKKNLGIDNPGIEEADMAVNWKD